MHVLLSNGTNKKQPSRYLFIFQKMKSEALLLPTLCSNSFSGIEHVQGHHLKNLFGALAFCDSSREDQQNRKTPKDTKESWPLSSHAPFLLSLFPLSFHSASEKTMKVRDALNSTRHKQPLRTCIRTKAYPSIAQSGAQSGSGAISQMTCTNSFLHSQILSKHSTLEAK